MTFMMNVLDSLPEITDFKDELMTFTDFSPPRRGTEFSELPRMTQKEVSEVSRTGREGPRGDPGWSECPRGDPDLQG